ncbi:1753_t:CDS:2 [Rhizophagus irregularis]|nr:1753_t:CDS:2 [Rhizophagus irregularis]
MQQDTKDLRKERKGNKSQAFEPTYQFFQVGHDGGIVLSDEQNTSDILKVQTRD